MLLSKLKSRFWDSSANTGFGSNIKSTDTESIEKAQLIRIPNFRINNLIGAQQDYNKLNKINIINKKLIDLIYT